MTTMPTRRIMDKTSIEVESGHLYLGPVVDAASGDPVNDDPTAIEDRSYTRPPTSRPTGSSSA
jgi:hypothetical protein